MAQIFQFEGHEIRFIDGKPVANDVAAVLGYADPAKTISTKVKSKNKGVAKMANTRRTATSNSSRGGRHIPAYI
jgi:prophage antirepressor-like protein